MIRNACRNAQSFQLRPLSRNQIPRVPGMGLGFREGRSATPCRAFAYRESIGRIQQLGEVFVDQKRGPARN